LILDGTNGIQKTAFPSLFRSLPNQKKSMEATFLSTYSQFLRELTLTFPEYAPALKAAESCAPADFGALWSSHTGAVAAQDATLFSGTGMLLVPGVRMTAALWAELSPATQKAIWKYLSSLLLLYTAETKEEGLWDLSGFKADVDAMMKRLSEKTDLSGVPDIGGAMPAGFATLFEKLIGMAGKRVVGEAAAAGAAASSSAAPGAAAAAPPFKVPERLFKGHIAKIAEELVREFKPEEFGIDAAMLESKDPAHVFTYLQEIFTKRPEVMMNAAQKIGKRLQAKFAKGEINRDEIIREAEELMKEFSDNEAFSGLFGSLGELFKSGEKESGNEGSARRREVQERLRKKAAAKKETGTAAAATAARMPTSNIVVDVSSAAAAAAAEASLLEEDAVAEKADKKRHPKR